jgi:hypothetical protein
MSASTEFPHLRWSHLGSFEVSFGGGREKNPEVEAAKSNRTGHAGKIRGQVDSMRRGALSMAEQRQQAGLPEVKGKGFLLRVPEGIDVDALAHALGIELVAETESGLMFAASDTLDFTRLEEVLKLFEINAHGGGGAASVLDVFDDGKDERKLAELLVGLVLDAWPFQNETVYTFDIGIQTSPSSRKIEWTRLPRRRRDQSDEDRVKQEATLRLKDRISADEAWMEAADERYSEIDTFVRQHGGEIVDGLKHDEPRETRRGIVFPDSIEVRVRMSGEGFRDLVENFPHLFEVSLPPEVGYLPGSPEMDGFSGNLEILPPAKNAPKICVIDSGIQEEHQWLASAIDVEMSRCFIPELDPRDVADGFSPRGHGTRVAGAVLYPRDVPKSGEHQSVAWLQNARVLDASCQLPLSLPPERYLMEVVSHFSCDSGGTRIFNHSISDLKPCRAKRMCAWAAKIDDLVHRHDLLFIQVSGNFEISEIFDVLRNGGEHPDQLLADEARVASPGQSLHALTVGSVAHAVYDDGARRSFATFPDHPSAFSRAGHSPLWGVVKPEVVEYGGDRIREEPLSRVMPTHSDTAPELIASTLHGAPAISKDDVGTSFAAPKVAHIAAHLQSLFPDASALLYRALIVQSARWPSWAEAESERDKVLRLIGYGLPSLERATTNNPSRITLITEAAQEIWSKQYHLYQLRIPDRIRGAAQEGRIRIDVTLAYSACPRRTRSRRTGYLETWLDWRASGREEPFSNFKNRMEGNAARSYAGLPWKVHQQAQYGEVDVSRDRGSVQKDWAIIEANELPEELSLAIRAHVGWNHKEGGGLARYCLVVSFEALDVDLPIYTSIEASVRGEVETETQSEGEIALF